MLVLQLVELVDVVLARFLSGQASFGELIPLVPLLATLQHANSLASRLSLHSLEKGKRCAYCEVEHAGSGLVLRLAFCDLGPGVQLHEGWSQSVQRSLLL